MDTAFAHWLTALLTTGESVQSGPPDLSPRVRSAVRDILREAFDRHMLDVAGSAIAFDVATAEASSLVLAVACWRLASGDAMPLPPLPEPGTPAAHLSADVCLRFLPAAYRRAKAADAESAGDVEQLLRRWPLSGVLADLDGGPATPPTFAGHPGLQMLYAERLAARPRAGWVPPIGPARDAAARAFAERNIPLPAGAARDDD